MAMTLRARSANSAVMAPRPGPISKTTSHGLEGQRLQNPGSIPLVVEKMLAEFGAMATDFGFWILDFGFTSLLRAS